ncbi:MAG: tetratricopeptide repeat protein [Clostridia bacterium]|nr:tetratricopeptide repeat protein [Clostridia bacterium]
MKRSNENRFGKILRILMPVFYGVVLLAALAVLVIAVMTEKQDLSFWLKGGLVIVTMTAAFIGSLTGSPSQKNVGSKKSLYHERYGEFIGRAFETDPKAGKKFLKAVDCYAHDKPADGLPILKKLYDVCQTQEDRYAVVTFMALCLDDMQIRDKAIEMYAFSLRMKQNTTIASNMGLCHERIGEYEPAMAAYEQSIAIDPNNAFAHNNMAVLLIRQGDYEGGLRCAEKAVNINHRMPQALNSMAVCHYMLGNMDEYQKYYRQAVSAGSDGPRLKAYIKSLDATV